MKNDQILAVSRPKTSPVCGSSGVCTIGMDVVAAPFTEARGTPHYQGTEAAEVRSAVGGFTWPPQQHGKPGLIRLPACFSLLLRRACRHFFQHRHWGWGKGGVAEKALFREKWGKEKSGQVCMSSSSQLWHIWLSMREGKPGME